MKPGELNHMMACLAAFSKDAINMNEQELLEEAYIYLFRYYYDEYHKWHSLDSWCMPKKKRKLCCKDYARLYDLRLAGKIPGEWLEAFELSRAARFKMWLESFWR